MGNYVETAVAFVGINKSTYYEWLNKAEQSTRRNKYTIFRDEIVKAKGFSEARDVAMITKHSEKHWQAAAWKLERKYPKKWGTQRPKEEPIKIDADVSHIQNEDLIIIKEVLDKIASRPKPNTDPLEDNEQSSKP